MMSKRSLRQQTSENCTLEAMSPGFVQAILADEVNLFFFAIGVIVISGVVVLSFFLSPVLLHEAAVEEFCADGGRDGCRVCVSTQLRLFH